MEARLPCTQCGSKQQDPQICAQEPLICCIQAEKKHSSSYVRTNTEEPQAYLVCLNDSGYTNGNGLCYNQQEHSQI